MRPVMKPVLMSPVTAPVVVGGLDLLFPGPHTLMPLLVAVPALAVLRPSGPRRAAAVALVTLAVAVVLAVAHWPAGPIAVSTCLPGTAFTTAMMWVACLRHHRGECARDDLRRVADVMRRAVLRPVPERVGPVGAEVRYLAAEVAASIGGDLYDVVDTPYGVRLIVGDAMGKGLAAVEKAVDVLGAFRELAQHERDLAGVAMRLDAFLVTRGRDEEFVTALLAEIPAAGSSVRLVNCGHPPPLLLAGGAVTFADLPASASAPPLGLLRMAGGWCHSGSVPFGPGDRLLLYTDGASEARDGDGRFYPLAERVAMLDHRDPAGLLGLLEDDLRAHLGGRRHDDAALLLVRRDPVCVPAW